MAKKKLRPHVGDPTDPESLSVLAESWLAHLAARNYSPSTITSRRRDLAWLLAWCDERSIARASEVTRAMLTTYQHALFQHRTKNDKPLTFVTQRQRLDSMRLFFRWLTRANVLEADPASAIEMPRVEKRLPKHVLTAREADLVITQPNVNDALGIRDRTILELLYSTGMRRAELCALEIFDVDVERGTVLIRQGKGKKDRVVPIGERACRWIEKYLADVRPVLAAVAGDHALFVSHEGERFTPDFLSRLVRGYVERAEIGKPGSCHLFRHAMATLMLENGADIRFIQMMLGHAQLSTTEIYTHVSIRKLKEIHTATHPSAKWEPAIVAGDDAIDDEPEDGRVRRRRRELNRRMPNTIEP